MKTSDPFNALKTFVLARQANVTQLGKLVISLKSLYIKRPEPSFPFISIGPATILSSLSSSLQLHVSVSRWPALHSRFRLRHDSRTPPLSLSVYFLAIPLVRQPPTSFHNSLAIVEGRISLQIVSVSYLGHFLPTSPLLERNSLPSLVLIFLGFYWPFWGFHCLAVNWTNLWF